MYFSHHIYVYQHNAILLLCRNPGAFSKTVLPLVVVWGGTIIVKTPFQYIRYIFRKTVIAWVLAHFLYSVFFVLVLITRSSREREIWLIGWSAAICVWVLVQVNIMNLVRCLFWIAICFLWRDKNICLATIRLYFASLTHAIRIYIVKYSDKRIVAFRPFLFSFFFSPHYYFRAALFLLFRCKQETEYC